MGEVDLQTEALPSKIMIAPWWWAEVTVIHPASRDEIEQLRILNRYQIIFMNSFCCFSYFDTEVLYVKGFIFFDRSFLF